MREELGFEPRYLAEDALLELAEQKRLRQFLPQSAVLAQSEDRLRAIIDHRQRGREWRSTSNPDQETAPRTDSADPSSVEQGGEDD
jgi:hypothetical protein